jgi:hypothetical protein
MRVNLCNANMVCTEITNPSGVNLVDIEPWFIAFFNQKKHGEFKFGS